MPTLEDLGNEAAQYLRDNLQLSEITISVKRTVDIRACVRVDVVDDETGRLYDYYQADVKVQPPPGPQDRLT